MINIYGFKMDAWTLVGIFGQFFFFLSFVVQWYHTEKSKASVFPLDFWYLRIVASFILMIYVIARKDIVFLISLILQLGIYFRNIHFIKKNSVQQPGTI